MDNVRNEKQNSKKVWRLEGIDTKILYLKIGIFMYTVRTNYAVVTTVNHNNANSTRNIIIFHLLMRIWLTQSQRFCTIYMNIIQYTYYYKSHKYTIVVRNSLAAPFASLIIPPLSRIFIIISFIYKYTYIILST